MALPSIAHPNTSRGAMVKLRLQIKPYWKFSRRPSMTLAAIGTYKSIPPSGPTRPLSILPLVPLHSPLSIVLRLSSTSKLSSLPLGFLSRTWCLKEEYLVSHLQELHLLDERCLKALNSLYVYQKFMCLQFNKKIKHHDFEVGDLVLQYNMKNLESREKKGKFEPNWLGQFFVTTKFNSGEY